jgi:tetratricopeptide (TPR) repeat protein
MVPGAPEELRFRRALQAGDRAIQEKDFARAETAILEANNESKDAPEVLLLRAKLLAARDRHAEALPLLDTFDRTVLDTAGREAGTAARNDIHYDLERKRTAFKQQLQKLQREGDYSSLRAAATQALALDPEDDDFQYSAAITAALFRDAAAKDRLNRYLSHSNSLRGNPDNRGRALRILGLLDPPRVATTAGTPNWLSGRALPEGVYYCPVSAAFQLPIDTVSGYKLKSTFQWDSNRLLSIATTFDDDKGAQNYHSMGGPAESQGNFFFAYAGNDPQLQVASLRKFDSAPLLTEVRVAHAPTEPPHLVDGRGQPRLLLQDSPQFNPAVLAVLEGPVATAIAGNSVFNPFIWDGLHYFTLTWDSQGRLATAQEWNTDNLVRFTWSADRLTDIRAFRKDSSAPYYQRTISYSGAVITGETYSQGSKTGQIKYVYSGKVLQQVKVEDGGVHDGKTWTVRLR